MDILQCILPCNISALERIRKIILAIYISCFAKSIFQTRSKKELYFRNFKCVSISEIHLNHEI